MGLGLHQRNGNGGGKFMRWAGRENQRGRGHEQRCWTDRDKNALDVVGGGASGHREMRGWAGLEDGGDEVGGSKCRAARMGAGQQKGWGCAFPSLPHLLPSRLPGLSFQGSPPLMFGRRLQQNPVVSSASGRGSSPPHLSAWGHGPYALFDCSDLGL